MSANWHYSIGGERRGPITVTQLKELATTGQLSPDDLVWREDMTEWRKARLVKGLFPQPEPSPPSSPLVRSDSTPAATDTTPATSSRASFGRSAKLAGQLAAKKTELTKIQQVSLPGLYAKIGKCVFETQAERNNYDTLFAEIEGINATIRAMEIASENRPEAKTLADKAKALGAKAATNTKVRAAQLQRRQKFAQLGRAAFEDGQALDTCLAEKSSIEKLLGRSRELQTQISLLQAQLSDHGREAASGRSAGENAPVWERPVILTLLVICCFPVGLLLLWTNPRISKGQKTLWTGAFCGLVVLAMVMSSIQRQATEKDLARATAMWDDGNKSEAVAIYQSVLKDRDMFVPDDQKPLVYGRVIDQLAEQGSQEEVQGLLEKLDRSVYEVTPLVESESAKQLLADIRREKEDERQRLEAEKRRREAETQQQKEEKVLAAAARNPITLDKPERADFLDNTDSYEGKAVRFECEWIGGGLRNRTTQRMTALELEVYHGSGFFKMNLTVPPDLDIPNIQVGDDLVVTFLCEEGLLNMGNTALKIERRQ